MAYIGQNADGNFTTSVSKDTFSGNGSTTAFTLSEGATTNTVDVFVENIRQEPTTAYTVDGTTLTFTAAPVSGTDNIYVVNRGPIQLSASHPAAQALTAYSATITTDLTVDTNTLFVDSTNNNVFVGKSSSDIGTTGIELQGGNDRIFVTRSGDSTLYLNRTTSDGSILEVLKDGTTVGSIGADGGALFIGNDDAGIYFNHHGGGDLDAILPYDVGSGALYNGHVDIGGASNRFKNLYLSGGAYLGGTGAPNKLDDYEEGTFTPTYIGNTTNPTVTYERQNGHYVKIGRQVIATVELRTTSVSGGSGNIYVAGLPFTPVTVSGQARSGTANVGYTSTFNGSNPQSAYINGDYNAVILMTNSGTDARGPLNTAISISNLNTGGGSNFLMLTAIYIAD